MLLSSLLSMRLTARNPSPLDSRAASLPWAGSTNKMGIKLLPLSLAGTSLPYPRGVQSAGQSWPKGQEPRAGRRAGKGPSPVCQAMGCYFFLSGLMETSP